MKHFISVVLALALVSCSFSAVFAANPQEHNVMLGTGKDETYNLVVLGDSNTTGLGLLSYMNSPERSKMGFLTRIEGAYPDLVAKEIEQKYGFSVDLERLAIPGNTYENLRLFLDPSLPLDPTFAGGERLFATPEEVTRTIKAMDVVKENGWNVDEWSREDKRSFLSPYYTNAVKSADQIIVDCGFSTIVTTAMNTLSSDEPVDFSIYTDKDSTRELIQLKQSISAKLAALVPEFSGKDKAEELKKIVDAALFAYLGETLNYDLLIKRIRQLNPDAEITVMSLVSPFNQDISISAFGQNDLPVGAMFNLIAELTNYHHQVLSAYADTVKYADCRKSSSVISFADELLAEDCNVNGFTPSTKSLYVNSLAKPFVSEDNTPLYGLDLEEILGDPADFANYRDAILRLRDLALHNRIINHSNDPMSDSAQAAFAMLGQYLSGQKSFDDFTEEEQSILIGTAGCWVYTGYIGIGVHPSELGHQQKAKAVMQAIGSSLSARQAKAVETYTKMETAKFEIRNAVKDQLREMADRRFEMKMDFAEGLKNSLEVSVSNMRNAFKNLLLAPILLPFGK